MKFYKLSNKEKQVMSVLWNSQKPLTASDICKLDSSLNINTVQASLSKLLKNQFIKVTDILYSGTVLSRAWEAVVTVDEYASMQLHDYYNSCSNKGSLTNLVNYFLNEEEHKEEILDELQEIINKRKQEL